MIGFENGDNNVNQSDLNPLPIPGINYLEVRSFLLEMGIYCEPSWAAYSYECEGSFDDENATVEINIECSDDEPLQIIYIGAEVEHSSENYPSAAIFKANAARILGPIAALPYTNSSPEYAQNWVINNVYFVESGSGFEIAPTTTIGRRV